MKKDYYVYCHKRADGTLFYIGKGRLKRAWSRTSRSTAWKETARDGFSVEIMEKDLTEKSALEIEARKIKETCGLVNKSTSEALHVSTETLVEHFKIDETSPSNLSRIKGVWTGVYFSGKIGHCGTVRKENGKSLGWKVSYLGRTLYVHRIIWQLVHGAVPDDFVIDHIDGNPLNNLIENLRLVSAEINSRNKKINSRNSTGVTGVRLRGNHYEAKVCCGDFVHYKTFSISKLGKEEAFRQACEYRKQKIEELNQSGAGYTDRHGL